MDNRLIKILACPTCKQSLAVSGDLLSCSNCNREYGLTSRGVPDFVREAETRARAESVDLDSKGFYQGGMLHKLMDTGSRIITSEYRVNSRIFREEIAKITDDTVAIEIGAGRRKVHQGMLTLDLFAFETVDVVCDAHALPIKSESCDFILLDAVLEHLQRPWEAVRECGRVLKKGGRIMCVVPFIHHFHAYPNDYFRYTTSGIRSLLGEDFEIIIASPYGGPSVALISLAAEWFSLFTFSKNAVANAIARAAFLALTWPLKYLDKLLVRNPLSENISSTLIVVAERKKSPCK